MTRRLTAIWRHPIKSHGRESLGEVLCAAGETLPHDRRWAVMHEVSRFDVAKPEWQPCSQFVIGAKSPRLQAMRARLDEATGTLSLTHPDLPTLRIDPAAPQDAAAFIEWMRPLANPNRPAPARLVSAGTRGMTDTNFPSVSLINLASHRAVEEKLGRGISPLRWRGNFIFESHAPWEEMDWPGKRLALGEIELEAIEPIQRCAATTASVHTGEVDADTLGTLNKAFGHQDCGLYARIIESGRVRVGDTLEVL